MRQPGLEHDPVTGQPVAAGREMIETKEFFRTSEFWVFAILTFALVITAMADGTFDADNMWPLLTALGVGYMISRGIAKAADAHPFRGRAGIGYALRGRERGYAASPQGYDDGYIAQTQPAPTTQPPVATPQPAPPSRAPGV